MLYCRTTFLDLSFDIIAMILDTMTATELINFRCCCIAFETIFADNEPYIIRGILRNRFYHTASTFFGKASAPRPLVFEDLKQIARRCDIADMLATPFGEHQVGQGSTTALRRAGSVRPHCLWMADLSVIYRIPLA